MTLKLVATYNIVLILVLNCVNGFHSGLFLVNVTKKSNDFAASWLISRRRFVGTQSNIQNAIGMASATFNTLRYKCKNCRSVQTIDFFDFMVEHLSSSTNQIPRYNEDIFNISNDRLQKYVQDLKLKTAPIESELRLSQTLGLLIFSSNCFSKSDVKIQRVIRPVFFEVTFWALHRYVKEITVFVATQQDADTVDRMRLPYFKLTILDVPVDAKNRTILLPRESLLNVITSLKSDHAAFRKFRYVYYSEGDQIVHMRDPSVLFDTIDRSNGTLVAVPHRMQTLTLKQDFPAELHSLWGASHAQDVPDARLVVENVHSSRGSCCSSGEVDVARCYGWWYQCADYGLKNFTTWLKFGENGFTMPPVTEHKATCIYHPERRLCELPVECVQRIPVVPNGMNRPLIPSDLCGEVQHSVHLGPPHEVAEARENARVAARKERDRIAAARKEREKREALSQSESILSPQEQQKAELRLVFERGVKKQRTKRSKGGKRTGQKMRERSGENAIDSV